jgi:outer membrane receptor protein involved in Fe transport
VSQQAIENSPIGILGSLATQMGLFNLQTPFSAPANFNPSNYREDNVDFAPVNKQQDNFMSGEWKQNLAPWLDSDLVLGYDNASLFSQQSYVGTPGLPFNQATLGTYTTNPGCAASLAGASAEYTFGCVMTVLGGVFGAPNYGALFAPFFEKVPGSLPTSSFSNLGISGGGVQSYMNSENAYDQSAGSSQETSAEMRFNTKFDGPLNAMIGFYYLHQQSTSSYQVASNTLDYGGILLGGFAGLIGNTGSFGPNYNLTGAQALCLTTGCLVGPTYYDNDGSLNTLTSKAVYSEVTYDALPSTLQFTLGARFTDDQKFQQARITIYDGLIPIGTNNYNAAVGNLSAQGQHSFDPNNTTCFAAGTACPAFQDQSVTFDKWTGEAKVDWTPKLDFTDQTLIYASYSSGYKAGGFNPGVEANLGTLSQTYLPESVDAYEIGTKNQLLGNTLQANGDIWYYNYNDLQVSAIINNTSINENINAKLWGVEGEFLWLPVDQLQFNLNVAGTHSGIGDVAEVDQRRPTGNDPNAILIKDDTLSSTTANNCVMYYAGAAPGSTPSGYTPFQGNIGALASQGIPYSVFGPCDPTVAPPAGYSWTDPAYHADSNGVPVSIKGDELQNTPALSFSVGAQYTQPLGDDYKLVGRLDYYWQTHMWGRIFEDPADYIPSWDVMNASLTMTAPDDRWYVQAFVKNIFNKNDVTGEYLSSATSGLFTNVFLGDPRLYGITVGVTL